MNKRITFEITQEEYDALCKFWEHAKKMPIGAPTALNFDDFCKELIISFTKGPNLSEMFKDLNFNDIMESMGDLSQLKDMFEPKKTQTDKKTEEKKEIPDDQKYKS